MDFQCLDFDTGLPSTTIWTQTKTNGGTFAISKALAYSAPNSLLGSVPAAPDYASQGTGTLTWSVVGADPVKSATIDARLNPPSMGGVTPPWTGQVDLMCLTIGDSSSFGSACLQYTQGSAQDWMPGGYTGLMLTWEIISGAAALGQCQVTGALTNGIWNTVELKGTGGGGGLSVLINGTSALSGCGPVFPATTAAKAVVGLNAGNVTSSSYSMYFDNVVVAVQR
jgi:hypothetical protein